MLPDSFLSEKPKGKREGTPEVLCQRKYIIEGLKLQFRGFTVPTYTLTFSHAREVLLMTNPLICAVNILLMLSLLKYGSYGAT